MKKDKNNEFNPYASDKLAIVPSWIKVLFLKYWVAAATFYFFGVANPLISLQGEDFDLVNTFEPYYLFLSLGLALFTEYITKNFIKFMKNDRDDTTRFNLINQKGVVSLFLNLAYAFAIMIPMILILVVLASHNLVFDTLNGQGNMAAIEPFTAGFVYIALDAIAVSIKNLILYLYKQAKFKIIEEENLKITEKIKNLSDQEYLDFLKEN